MATAPLNWPTYPFAPEPRVQQAVYAVLTAAGLTVWGSPSEGGPSLPPNPNDLPYVLNRDPFSSPATTTAHACKPPDVNIRITLLTYAQNRTDEIEYLDTITSTLTGGALEAALEGLEVYATRIEAAPSVTPGPEDAPSRREALYNKIWEMDVTCVPLSDAFLQEIGAVPCEPST